MSRNHHNHSCSSEHDDHHHDHDHGNDSGVSDNLYQYIDLPNVRVLNATNESESAANFLKPWDQRLDETLYVESDADDQLIIRVPFTGSVKLRSFLLKAGPGDQTPSKVSLFANHDHLDFDDASNIQSLQECTIVQSREIGDYAVKPAKFSNVSSITLFFPSSQGADSIRLYYLGFLGLFSERKEAPTAITYESQANPADHPKVQGTETFGTHLGFGGSGGAF